MAAATNDEKNYNLRLASFKQHADDLLAGSSPVVKIICASLGFGYLLSFTGSRVLDVLTILAGNVLPPNFWIWTFVTHVFIEIHSWIVLCNVSVVFLYGKLLEPLWGTVEMLKFLGVVVLGSATLSLLTYTVCYLVVGNTDFLFNKRICGFAGCVAGFSVAVKQTMPEQILFNSPFGKLRNRHVPTLLLLLAICVNIFGFIEFAYPVLFASGVFVSWVYLRFYQRHNNGNRGDNADGFSFASFFPAGIHPFVAIFSNTVFMILVRIRLCPKSLRKVEIQSRSAAVVLPGTEMHDAERQRLLALKALNERLSKVTVHPEKATPTSTPENISAAPQFVDPQPLMEEQFEMPSSEEHMLPPSMNKSSSKANMS